MTAHVPSRLRVQVAVPGYGDKAILIVDPPEGVTYRQIDYWIRLKLIDGGAPGSGHSRVLTVEEHQVLIRMATLVVAGVQPETAARMARDLIATGTTHLAGYVVSPAEDAVA